MTNVTAVTMRGSAVKTKERTPFMVMLSRTARSSACRFSSSCFTSAGSHAKSLRILMPCSSSLVNLTRLSRACIVRLVYFCIDLESQVLSGIEMIITPRPAKPATPRNWKSMYVAIPSCTGPCQSRCMYGAASASFCASICM